MTHNCLSWKLVMRSEKFLFWESSWCQQFFPLQSSRTWCSFYCQHSTAGSQGTISCLKRETPEGSCYQWVIAVICTWVKLIWIQYLFITLRRISFWVEDVKMVLPKDRSSYKTNRHISQSLVLQKGETHIFTSLVFTQRRSIAVLLWVGTLRVAFSKFALR